MAKSTTSYSKGQSGNPTGAGAGRKPLSEEDKTLQAMCKAYTKESLEVIIDIMYQGTNERNRLEAAKYMLERGWGKIKEIPDDQSDKQKEEDHFNSLSPYEQKKMLYDAFKGSGLEHLLVAGNKKDDSV